VIAWGARYWRRTRPPQQTLLTAGQTAGGIKEILRMAEIMRPLVAETEAVLSQAVDFR
jgi:hypothetical protein